jgi:hypothetical protein
MKTKLGPIMGAALGAWIVAGTAFGQRPDDERCGTTGTAPRPPAGARVEEQSYTPRGGAVGRPGGPGAVGGSTLPPPLIELPTGGAGRETLVHPAAPGGGSAVTAGQTPPPPPAPPAIPGLPPSSKEDDEDKRDRVEAIQAKGEVPEERLLDVGVAMFDPGVDESDRERLASRGLSPELRGAEARYMAFHLKKTMEGTGNWGAVRVLPGAAEGLDVIVTGRIVESNGKRLALEVDAVDATGRRWLHRRYKGEADVSAYRPDRVGQHEPFQEVYNLIANDLLAARDELEAPEIVGVRRVANLRFASQLAPAAFSRYLKPQGSARYSLVGLPAEGDPMVRRVAIVRERDQMLVDTLNEHYLSFYERMVGPYANWRQQSYGEQAALDKVHRDSMLKKLLGGAAMLAGMIMGGSSNQGARVGGDIAMIGGMAALQSGFQQGQEKSMHVAALKELAVSFDGEVTPLVVEVEGHQLRLTGPAEKQFIEWRELLQRVFAIETGVPVDPNAPVTVHAPSL